MENFKFIASFENDPWCDENDSSCESDCKLFLFDILNIIQYYCLHEILSRFGISLIDFFSYNLRLFNFVYFKNGQKENISELQNFIAYFNRFFNFNVSSNCGYILLDNDYFTFDKLIDKITEDMLINDFDKYIDAYDINKYTKVNMYTYPNKRGKLCYYMEAFMGDEVNMLYICDIDEMLLHGCRYPIIECSNFKFLDCECKEHLINNQGFVDNTMSEHIVYTSDLEVTKQVLRNNQKIINNIIKNLKNETSNEASNSSKQKLMQLLTSEETKPELKPKQRTKITL